MSTVTAPQRVPAAPAPSRRPSPRTTPQPVRRSAPRRPDLRVVRSDERRRRVGPAVGVVLTAVLFAGLFALAGAHTLLVQGQLHLDRLDADLAVERARYQELRLQVAELESPGRVVDVAQERLGMVPPAELVYLSPAQASIGGDEGERTELSGPEGGTDVAQAGDDAWSTVKPLLDAVTP
jgi:cell division protein FtsB